MACNTSDSLWHAVSDWTLVLDVLRVELCPWKWLLSPSNNGKYRHSTQMCSLIKIFATASVTDRSLQAQLATQTKTAEGLRESEINGGLRSYAGVLLSWRDTLHSTDG
jgi:hypothetical protein